MEIKPYIGIRGTYASYFQQNPNRKIKRTEKENHLYNVKSISEICQLGDRKEGARSNDTLENKENQINDTRSLSFEEILKNTINHLA